MIVLSSLPAKVFSSMVPDIVVTTTMTRVNIVVTFGGWRLYNEILYPDADGKITVTDIPGLIEPFVRRKLVDTLDVRIDEQQVTTDEQGRQNVTITATETMTAQVTYCSARVSENAESFCRRHFLSRLMGTKTTAVGRMEVLHYDSADEAVVTAYYDDGTSAVFNAAKIGGNDNYSTIDVTPSRFLSTGKNLYRYEVHAGERLQEFVIDMSGAEAAPALLFTNSFGCQETFFCTGLLKTSPEITYNTALIGLQYENYNIHEIRNLTADTGPLTEQMAEWLSDLFRSNEIYLLKCKGEDFKPGARITLSNSNSSFSNADDDIPRFVFTYRIADKNQNFIDTEAAGRIFDSTFDVTFN